MNCRTFAINAPGCFRNLMIALQAGLLCACATAPDTAEVDPLTAIRGKGYEVGQSVSRINNFRLVSWNYVDRKSVLITVSPRHKYLVVFSHTCRSLNRSSTLVTRHIDYSLNRLDMITVVDGAVDKERCAIGEIYEVTKQPAP